MRLIFSFLVISLCCLKIQAQQLFLNGKIVNKLTINGQFHEIKIDTLKLVEDTLWIKTSLFVDNKLKEYSLKKGSLSKHVNRTWHGPKKIRLIRSSKSPSYYKIIPGARYRNEGIIIHSNVTKIKGSAVDSVIYSGLGFGPDSIKNSKGELLWKYVPKPNHATIGAASLYILKETPLREERKKKRQKGRRK